MPDPPPYEADDEGKPPEFDLYRIGPIFASVCSSLPPADVERVMNASHPTGIRSSWHLSLKPRFSSGETNPCACERAPTTHKHYLLSC